MDINLLNQLVSELKQLGVIQSIEVEKAFSTVLRHKFIETFYLPRNLKQPIINNPNSANPEHLKRFKKLFDISILLFLR